VVRQRVFQLAAGYEDYNDMGFLRIDPALQLLPDKKTEFGAGQSMLCRPENEILGREEVKRSME
jgi:hypothetical protein